MQAASESAPGLLPVSHVYDGLADVYDDRFSDPSSQREDDFVFSFIPDGGRVLDLGCGTGSFLDRCNPSSYLGLDVSAGMLRRARQRHPLRTFIHGDMRHPKLWRDMHGGPWHESYDLVVSLYAFNHVPAWPVALALSHAALRPGGKMVVVLLGRRHLRKSITGVRAYSNYIDPEALMELEPFSGKRLFGYRGPAGSRWPSLMALEAHTLGRLMPERFDYMLVELVK